MHERTGARETAWSGRRGRAPMMRVELAKLFRRPRTWVTILLLNALPTLVAVLRVGRPASRRRPGRGRRSSRRCWPTGRCSPSRRWRSCCRCSCRSRWPWWPATRSPARRRPARCATCWSARSGAPGCWWPSSSRRSSSCWSSVLSVAVVGFGVGRLLLGHAAAVAGDGQRVRDARSPRPDRLAGPARDRLHRRSRCSASRRWRCSAVHADRLARWPRPSARWRSSSGPRCC